jgi:hypothetical protein
MHLYTDAIDRDIESHTTGTYSTYYYIKVLKYVNGNGFYGFYDDAARTLRSLVSAQWGRVRNGRFSVSLYRSIFFQQKRRDER